MAQSSRLAANAMGTRDLVFTVLATLAPLTLVVAVAPLHFLKGGAAVPGGYLVGGVVMALFAVGFMTMSRYVRNAGAFYAAITRGLGRPVGAAAAMLAVVAYNALQISTYGAIGVFASNSVERYLDLAVPWWGFALVALVLVAWLGFRGIHTSAQVLGVVLVLEILVLLVMAVAVLVQGGAGEASFTSFAPTTVLSPENGAMFALVIGAFMGFEATAIYSEEARGGIRTVRRATYIAVAFIALFYAFITWTIVHGVGVDRIEAAAGEDTEDIVVSVFEQYTPGWVTGLMEVLLMGSAFAALLALHNAANRYLFALGREHLLPVSLGRTHERTCSPYVAGVVQTVLAFVVLGVWVTLGLDPFLELLLWGSSIGFVGIITLWALCCLSVIVFLRRAAPETGLWRSVVAPGLSFAALCVLLVLVIANVELLTGAGTGTNVALIGLGVVALIVGAGAALRLRTREPDRYATLTEMSMETDEDPASSLERST